MERELDQNSQAISEFGRDTDQAANKMDKLKAKAKQVGASLKSMGDKLSGIGQKMSVGITAPLVGGFVAITKGTKDLRQDLGKLEAAFTTNGFSVEQAKEIYYDFYGILGESDTAIEAVNHLAKLTKSQEELNKWTTIATGVYATFGDSLPIEGLTEAANETAKVAKVTGPLADALNWAGVSEDAFNESLAACTSEQERQKLITETLNGLYGETAAKYREVNAELIKSNEANAKLSASLAKLGTTLEPILTPVIEKITELVNKFNEMDPATQKTIIAIAGIAAAAGPLLVVIGSVVGLFGSLTLVAGGLGIGVGALVGIIGGVVAVVAAVIAIGILLWKNWDTIKAKATELSESVRAKFEEIKSGISEKINAAKDAVHNAIEKIKSFFRFEWSLPRIKLPHFSIQGKFSLNPPQIPKFAVDWYKTGGIFNSPSIIGVGEAGAEAVLPIDRLSGIIAKAMETASKTKSEVKHTGTIRVEGVNSRGELQGVVDMVLDKLQWEARMT
jgi:phage-related minor tail protein